MITRDEAINLLKKYLREDKLVKHSLAVEAILIEMARKLGEDENLWGLTGLLHDLDYEYTKNAPEKHTVISSQLLEGLLPDISINAIKAHNYTHTNCIPINTIDKALIAADAVSGLVIATALIVPSKKISNVKPDTLLDKYNDTSFARGCDRNRIKLCLDEGVNIETFLKLSLDALKKISDELDL